MVARASARTAGAMSVRFAKFIRISNSFSLPTRRQALIPRRNKASDVNRASLSTVASSGKAPSIDRSSLIARAASVAINSFLSLRNSATFSLFNRRKTNTAAVLTTSLGWFASATMGSSLPIRESARTPACLIYKSSSLFFSIIFKSGSMASANSRRPNACAAKNLTRGFSCSSSGINWSAAAL